MRPRFGLASIVGQGHLSFSVKFVGPSNSWDETRMSLGLPVSFLELHQLSGICLESS